MTDKHAGEMTDAEFQAARDAMWRDAAARQRYSLQADAARFYCEQNLPDHAEWLEQHGQRPSQTSVDSSKALDDTGDEAAAERLEQIKTRNAEIDAAVTEQVRRFMPHLFADDEAKPVSPKSELDTEVAAIAENFLRSRG